MALVDALTALEQYRAQLARRDAAALERLVAAYRRLYSRLEGNIEALVLTIGEEQPTKGQITRMARYQALMRQVSEELSAFGVVLRDTVDQAAIDNITLGEAHARAIVSQILAGDGSLSARFNVLPRETIENLLGFLAADSRLYESISTIGDWTRDDIANRIVEGVGLGQNSRKIAAQIRGGLGGGLTSALRLTRTVQMYSYREANRASFVANGDIVDGWIWYAQRDAGTCMSCIVQHGTWHPLSEVLNDHHNGRCTMLPSIKAVPGYDEIAPGTDWFEQQDENTQRQMMGKGRYEAWRAGSFGLGDLSSTRDDEVYGTMRVETPLKALVRE